MDSPFLGITKNLVCVPFILGAPGEKTGDLYLVESGLSFVLLNSEGMYLGTHFRPALDDLKKAIETSISKNKELLDKAQALKKKLKKLSGGKQIDWLASMAYYYLQGKAYSEAIRYYQEALKFLESSPNESQKIDIINRLLGVYITLQESDKILELASPLEPKGDYILMSLGMAHHIKFLKGDKNAISSAKKFFEQMLTEYPQSNLVSYVKEIQKQY